MSETVLSALITGGLALLGVIITNIMSARKIEHKLQLAQAVTSCMDVRGGPERRLSAKELMLSNCGAQENS